MESGGSSEGTEPTEGSVRLGEAESAGEDGETEQPPAGPVDSDADEAAEPAPAADEPAPAAAAAPAKTAAVEPGNSVDRLAAAVDRLAAAIELLARAAGGAH